MIERLFAQQAQGRAFLWLLLGGLAVGCAAHAAALVRRRWQAGGVALEAAVAVLLLAVLLYPVIVLETPLRLYGLLGLSLGAATYFAGAAAAVEALFRRMKKSPRPPRGQKENPP